MKQSTQTNISSFINQRKLTKTNCRLIQKPKLERANFELKTLPWNLFLGNFRVVEKEEKLELKLELDFKKGA